MGVGVREGWADTVMSQVSSGRDAVIGTPEGPLKESQVQKAAHEARTHVLALLNSYIERVPRQAPPS